MRVTSPALNLNTGKSAFTPLYIKLFENSPDTPDEATVRKIPFSAAALIAIEAEVPARDDQGKNTSNPQNSPAMTAAAPRKVFFIDLHPLSSALR